MYKSGATVKDQVTIKEMLANGHTSDEISESLQIELDCIKSFVEHFGGEIEKPASKVDPAIKKGETKVKDPVAAALEAANSTDKE